MLTTEVYATYQWFLNGIPILGAVDQTLFFTDPGLYTVEVTNEYDCMATSDIFDLTNLSIDYVNLTKLSIYPNPSNGHVTISYVLAVGSTIMLEIKDVSGKTLYSSDTSDLSAGSYEHQLDLSSFASGIYFAIIRVNSDMVINKLIIQ